jgi:hypothetical protein
LRNGSYRRASEDLVHNCRPRSAADVVVGSRRQPKYA